MSALGSLVVRLALDYAEYTRGLDRSEQESLDFARRVQEGFDNASGRTKEFFTGIVKGAVGAAAAMVTVGAAVEAMNRSINDLAALDDLNQKTGAAIGTLSRLQAVASEFDHDFGSVDAAITKLSKGMNGVDEDSSKISKALKALGLSAKDSAGNLRDPGEVMIDVAKALQGYEDGAAKAALVTDLFGKAGADLIPFLNDAAGTVDQFAERTQEAVEQAAAFQDQTGKMRRVMRDLSTDITVAALPAVNDFLGAILDTSRGVDELTGKDVTGWADDLGLGLARVTDVAILIPRLLQAIGGSFKAVWADVESMGAVLENANPVAAVKAWANGKSPNDAIAKALAKRNAIVDESNRLLVDLWNKPANEMEQAFLKRLAARGAAKPDEPAAVQKQLAYQSNGDKEKQERNDYEALNKAVVDRLALLQAEVVAGHQLSDAEKEIAKIQQGRKEGTVKLTDAEAESLVGRLELIDSMQRSAAAGAQVKKLYDDLAKASRDKVAAAVTEAETNERLVETTGRSRAEIEAMGLARLEEQYAQRSSVGMTLDEIEELEKLIAARKRSSAALTRVEGIEQAKKGLDELNAFLDPAKAQTFGESLKEAFGTAGDAASKLVGVLDGYGQRQAEIDKQRANAADALKKGLIDEAEHTRYLAQLSEKETKNRLSGYGDMAGAAAGFFDEQSRGYQTLMAVSKVFHAAELAMTLAELVPKGIAAVLNQGTGDPYTAFARMAAMAAIVTGLGVAIGGVSGGGGQSAADLQKAQGTGSVLGDADAKSESIANSLELIEENSDRLIPINREMLTALQSIDAAMSGVTNLLVRVPGLVNGENMGIATGTIAGAGTLVDRAIGGTVGSIAGLAFGPLGPVIGGALGDLAGRLWGKTKQTIVDSGLQFGGSVRDLQAGVGYNQYASVDTTKSSWFGLKKTTSNSVQTAALSDDLSAQFGLIFTNVEAALSAAAVGLGVGADHVTQVLDSLSIDMTKVSLKDLKGDELTDALNAVISKTMDDMAEAVFPDLDRFRQVGEGYAETVVRVASDYARLDAALTSMGGTFGAVGMSSLQARERLITLTGGIDQLEDYASSFAENYLTEAERLAPVQAYVTEQLAAMGLASVTTRDQFKEAALSIDTTTEAGAKQFAAMMALEAAFAAVTPAMNDVASAAEIAADRAKLEAQIYDMTHTAAEALARQRAEELAAMDESLHPLQERIYALQDEETALAKVKETANALLSQVDSAFGVLQGVVNREREAATAAYEAQMKSIEASINGVTAKITKLQSLSQVLGSALDQMRDPGGVSVASRAAAQAQIQTALAIAKAGGSLPDADAIKNALSTVTQDASSQFATYTDYLRDFYSTANDVASLGKLTDSALSVEELTLESLEDQREEATAAHEAEIDRLDDILSAAEEQINVLKGMDTSLLSIEKAIQALGAAIASAQQNAVVSATAAINQAYQTALGRAPDAAGLEYWQQQAANGSSTGNIVDAISNSKEAQLQNLYTSLLGRTADGAGMTYWMGQINAGMSIDTVRELFKADDEYKSRQAASVPAFATGGDHVGGARIVGENGPELEVTGPARIFNASQTARMLGGGNDDLAAEVARLTAVVRRQEALLNKIAESSSNAATAGAVSAKVLQRATQGKDYFMMKEVAG